MIFYAFTGSETNLIEGQALQNQSVESPASNRLSTSTDPTLDIKVSLPSSHSSLEMPSIPA